MGASSDKSGGGYTFLQVKHLVYRVHFVWAAARLIALTTHPDCDPMLAKGKPSKRRILADLRVQLDMFGSDEDSLMGPNWEEDYKKFIPAADALVRKLWPKL